MAEKFVYTVELNTNQARQAAQQLQAVMRAVNRAAANSPEARAAAQQQIEQQRRVTAQVRSDSQVRIQAARAEAAERTQQARAAAQASIEAERRITQAARAEAASRAQAQRQAAPSQSAFGGSTGGLGSMLAGGIAGYFSIQGARQIAQQAASLDELRSKSVNLNAALELLAGGSAQASTAIAQIQAVTPGAVSQLDAAQSAVTIFAQKLPSAAASVGEIAQAASLIARFSPSISDTGDALAQLTLFGSSSGFARADQLLVTAGAVKQRIDELAAAYPELEDSQLKSAATVQLVNERFGPLAETVRDNITGVQQLSSAYSDFKQALALGPAGAAANEFFENLATRVNSATVALGGGTATTQQSALQNLLSGEQERLAALQGGQTFYERLGFSDSSEDFTTGQVESLQKLAELFERVNKLAEGGAPGAVAYQQQLSELVATVVNQRTVTDEQTAALAALEGQYGAVAAAANDYAIAQQSAGDSQALESQAAAAAEVQQAYQEALSRVIDLQAGLSQIAGLPGADQIASQVNALATELLYSSSATEEQLNALAELEAIMGGASAAADYFTGATGGAAGSSANFGIQLNGLLGPLSSAEAGMYATGDAAAYMRQQIASAMAQQAAQAQFKTLQSQFQSQLLGASRNIVPLVGSGGAIDYYNQRQGASDNFIRGLQGQGLSDAEISLKLTEFTDQQTAAAEAMVENAREQERLQKAGARSAESAFNKAAKETEKAFKDAAADFISKLKSTPGLFGTSDVTQEQMDLAAAGVPQNFADDYLRRLRDEVENGKDYEGVSIEGAREALSRIGVVASDNAKAALEQFASAWDDSSLFASKENLALINAEAVQQNLELQDKIKEGQENILEFFANTVDEALRPYILGEDVTVTGGGGGGVSITPRAPVTGVTGADGALSGIDPTSIQAQLSALTVPPITVTAISVDPVALEGLWTGLKPPAITITAVSVGPTVQTAFSQNLNTQLTGPLASADYKAIGGMVGGMVETGVAGRTEHVDMAASLRGAIDTQVTAQKEQFTALGNGPSLWVEEGFIAYVHGDMAQDFLSDLAGQWVAKIPDFTSHGGVIAGIVEQGFVTHKHGDMAQAFFNTLSGQFGGAGAHGEASNLDKFKNLGITLAGQVEFGFTDPERGRGDLAGPTITAVQTQFAQQVHIDSLKRVGEDAAYWIEWGLTGYPWGGVAASLIGAIQTGLATEENVELLIAAGKNDLGKPLAQGVIQAFKEQDWAELANEVVTGVLTSLAEQEA